LLGGGLLGQRVLLERSTLRLIPGTVVVSVAYSPRGDLVAAARGGDGKIKLFRTRRLAGRPGANPPPPA